MSERPESPQEEARLWKEYADADMRMAKLALDNPDQCPPWLACYHAQQAAEKALKALLIARGREFPLNRDIRLLMDLCEEVGVAWKQDVCEAEILVPYAVSCRYPSAARELTGNESKHAVELAERVCTAVEVETAA